MLHTMTTILSVTPPRRRAAVLSYGNSGPLPSTIIIGSTPVPRPPLEVVSLVHSPQPLQARWGSRVSIFRKHFRPYDSLGNWKARPTNIIKTKVHYTYLIPIGGCSIYAAVGINSFLDCVHGGNHSHPKGVVWKRPRWWVLGEYKSQRKRLKRKRAGTIVLTKNLEVKKKKTILVLVCCTR